MDVLGNAYWNLCTGISIFHKCTKFTALLCNIAPLSVLAWPEASKQWELKTTHQTAGKANNCVAMATNL